MPLAIGGGMPEAVLSQKKYQVKLAATNLEGEKCPADQQFGY